MQMLVQRREHFLLSRPSRDPRTTHLTHCPDSTSSYTSPVPSLCHAGFFFRKKRNSFFHDSPVVCSSGGKVWERGCGGSAESRSRCSASLPAAVTVTRTVSQSVGCLCRVSCALFHRPRISCPSPRAFHPPSPSSPSLCRPRDRCGQQSVAILSPVC